MVLRSRYFLIYLLGALVLGVPSYVSWFRQPFLITRDEYDWFLGAFPGPEMLLLGKLVHFAVILLMSWAYYRLIVTLAAGPAPAWGQVLTASALLIAVAAAYVPWLSPDAFFYFGTGWLDSHYQLNVYQAQIADAPNYQADPLFQNVFEDWKHANTPYGPLFVKFIGVVTQLGAGDDRRCLMVLKAFLVFFHLLNGWLLYVMSGKLGLRAPLAVLTYLASPVLLLTSIGWAHNDVMMVTLILAALWALLGGKDVLCVVFLGLGAGLKYVPLLLFPFFFIYMVRRDTVAAAARKGAVLAAVLAAVVIAPYLWYAGDVTNFRRLFAGQGQLYRNFLYYIPLLYLPGPEVQWFPAIKLAYKLAFLAVYAAVAWSAWQARAEMTSDRVLADVILWLLVYFTIGSPELHEWYICWFVGVIFLINDRTYFQAGMLLTAGFNPLVIFEVKTPDEVRFLCWQLCFLVFWAALVYIGRKGRPVGSGGPSPLFATAYKAI